MRSFLWWYWKTAAHALVFSVVCMSSIAAITYALTYNWSDPSTIRGKTSSDTLTSGGWNMLVGNVDNLNERLANAEWTITSLNSTVTAQAAVISTLAPAGAVVAFNLTDCPNGWTIADGAGGRIDLRGEFIRGLDKGRNIDPSRSLASAQGATRIRELIDHYAGYSYGTLSVGAWNIEYGMSLSKEGLMSPYASLNNSEYYQSTTTASVGTWDNNGFAVRPRNVALLYCIKD